MVQPVILANVCVCGADLQNGRRICSECAETYGKSPNEWPGWFKSKFNDLHRIEDDLYEDDEDELEEVLLELKSCEIEAGYVDVEAQKTRSQSIHDRIVAAIEDEKRRLSTNTI